MSEELWNGTGANGTSAPGPEVVAGEEANPAPPPSGGGNGRPPLAGRGPKPGSALTRLPATETHFTPEQRLLILDAWRRSGLPAGDFAPLVGVSKHTLYAWQKRFTTAGPAGLLDQPKRARSGSRMPEVTKRAILMVKEANPD
jgi:Homeodomain-like domain